jgi:hypothetical protein
VVADGQILDALADLGDDAGTLVSAQDGKARDREATGQEVLVGPPCYPNRLIVSAVTDPGAPNLDHYYCQYSI